MSNEALRISMSLYETNTQILQAFIDNVNIDDEITEEYLILYNFAIDCIYLESIQPSVIQYLLPFYKKVISRAVLDKDRVALDIYCNFNSALFKNRSKIEFAMGEMHFKELMNYYINLTRKCLEVKKRKELKLT